MIKKLQNNFTTPEQSERLLELGVPADSADCYTTTNNGRAVVLNLLFSEFMENIVAGGFNNPDAYLPCWSVGRLIEIMALCYKFDFSDSGSVQIYTTDVKKGTVVDVLISDIERFINKIDFSKLEE